MKYQKNVVARILSVCLIFGLIIISLKIKWPDNRVHALNRVSNYGFETTNEPGNSWTVGGTTLKSTETMVRSTSSPQEGTYSFNGYWLGTGKNGNANRYITQTYTPVRTQKAKMSAYYKRYGTGAVSNFTFTIKLLSGASTVSTIVAVSNPAGSSVTDASWQNSGWTSEFSLDAGSSYTIEIRWDVGVDTGEGQGAYVDNIQLQAAPIDLTSTAVTSSTNILISWSASNGSPGLSSATSYKIFRGESSPLTSVDYLSSTSYGTTTFTDTSTTGNKTYYYAISDYDTSSIESPLSSETNKLTRPGPPSTPSFTNVKDTTLRVNWSAPSGEAVSYKVERCPGTGCTNFSNIASGETNIYYNDSNLTANTLYRYRIVATNATGDGSPSSIADVTTKIVSIQLMSDGQIEYGIISPGSSISTLLVQPVDTQTVKNIGNINSTFNIKTSSAGNGVPWAIGADPGDDIFVHEYSPNGGSAWLPFFASDSYYTLTSGINPESSQNFDLKITLPTIVSDTVQKSITVTVQVIAD